MTKHYKAYWGEGYSVETTEEHELDWFNEEKGYENEQRYILDSLNIGDVANFSCVTGTHTVERIK